MLEKVQGGPQKPCHIPNTPIWTETANGKVDLDMKNVAPDEEVTFQKQGPKSASLEDTFPGSKKVQNFVKIFVSLDQLLEDHRVGWGSRGVRAQG